MRIIKLLIPLLLVSTMAFGSASRDFDGLNDNVDFGNMGSWNPTSGFSICAWIDPDSYGEGSVGRVFDKSAVASNSAGVSMFLADADTGTGNESIKVWRDATTDAFVAGSESSIVLAGGWHWVCGTINSSMNAFTLLRGTTSSAVDINGDTQNGSGAISVASNPGTIGSNQSTERSYNGLIAYVHIYDAKLLSTTEVLELQYKPFSIADNLKLGAPLFGDSTEIDYSANNYSGTVTESTGNESGPPVMFGGGLPL